MSKSDIIKAEATEERSEQTHYARLLVFLSVGRSVGTSQTALGFVTICQKEPEIRRNGVQLPVAKPYRKARLIRNRILAALSGIAFPADQATAARWWSPRTGRQSSPE